MTINDIIVKLMVIANFAKDVHYTCKGEGAYGKHLLADLVHGDINDFIDELKENALLGQHELPLPSKQYLKMASEQTPDVAESDVANFNTLASIIDDLRKMLEDTEAKTRGIASLFDKIVEHLDKAYGLIWLQVRDAKINEEVEHDHKAATEKPVDREEYEAVIPQVTPAQKLGLKYEEQNLLVAEETKTNVDKLFDKLKELGG